MEVVEEPEEEEEEEEEEDEVTRRGLLELNAIEAGMTDSDWGLEVGLEVI